MDERVKKLLASSNREDHMIGLNLLINKYKGKQKGTLKRRLWKLFDSKGNTEGRTLDLLSIRAFKLDSENKNNWSYYHLDDIGFYVDQHIMIVKHPHPHMSSWEPIEL